MEEKEENQVHRFFKARNNQRDEGSYQFENTLVLNAFCTKEQYCYVSLDYDASLADPAFQVNFSPVCLQYQQSHNNHTFLKSK